MTDNSHSDIDRAGDLLLLLGCKGEQKTVRVSSKILSLASPVFAVMLSWIFAEGQNSGDENWTVSLSHDDPEAMLTVLRVLHFKPTCTTETSLLFLAKMAEVCEKYDLTEPLKGWTEAALRHGGEIHGELGSSKLLKISCALGSHQAFWLSSYKIIMRYLEEKVPEDQDFEIECATIPDNLLASIKTHRHYVFHDIQDKVEHIISPYVKAMAIEVDDTITHFFRLLNQITLWPLSSISSSKKLEQVLWALKQGKECRSSGGCRCRSIDIPGRLQEISEQYQRSTRGLCLSCVKDGRISFRERNCGAFNPIDCCTSGAASSLPYFFSDAMK